MYLVLLLLLAYIIAIFTIAPKGGAGVNKKMRGCKPSAPKGSNPKRGKDE